MAFIAPIAGIFSGGGLLAGLGKAVLGLGINLAIAHFFPQKVKGPRAENLKAQTSKYNDYLARVYGTGRTAGAVTWLKGDKVDEHVRTYRQGKALGPEVTEYSYTATFAVAFAWNGPVAAIPRIWADDKLIYDASAEALQDAIDTGGSAIGVAQGATVTVYLGTDTQQPDPDIEADRGAGNVPAWPGRAYVVIKNLPLDEFGIRVPNIEAEVIHNGTETTASVAAGGFSGTRSSVKIDTNGDYFASVDQSTGAILISRLPSPTVIYSDTPGYLGDGIHITDRFEVLVTDADSDTVYVYDAATGALMQTLTGVGPGAPDQNSLMDDITINGTTYVLIWRSGNKLTLISNDGNGYDVAWSATTTHSAFEPPNPVLSLSVGPDFAYAIAAGGSPKAVAAKWSPTGLLSESLVTLPGGGSDGLFALHYDNESDSVIGIDIGGNIWKTTPDLVTLLNSNTSTGIALFNTQDQLASRRLKSGSDRFVIKDEDTNDLKEFLVSDLTIERTIVAGDTTWTNRALQYHNFGVSQRWSAVLVTNSNANQFWFLPLHGRGAEPIADVIDAEAMSAGLTVDASGVTGDLKGYAVRDASPPRGVIEDICRINAIDWAHVDGVTTFFPRNTAAIRTLTVEETGMALNAEPDPVQVKEELPDGKDIPEQTIISYMSWDAEYRAGSQAGTPEEDFNFPDEPAEADETGFPVKVRKKRALELSTAQVMTDQEAIRAADVISNDLRDSASIYRTTVGPKHLDLYPGLVINLPLDDTRTAKAVITKMTGETVIELEARKRGDSFTSDAVAQPTPYVVDTLLGIAPVGPVLIDGHLLRAADNNDGFYAGVAVTGQGQFRSATLFQSEDSGTTYQMWAAFVNGMIRGIAVDALPDRAHPGAWDRATEFTIAVPTGEAPDSVSEAALLASETSNGFSVWNESVGDWEYIRAASVVDNLDGTWTLSTLLRGQKGTEFAMSGHAAGAAVYHLDSQAMDRATDGDRTLPRIYVAVASGTVFDSTGAVAFTNQGKGLRPWSPCGLRVDRDGSGNITGTFNRRDRLGQEWPESGNEEPPMSESAESYKVKVYDGVGALLRTITVSAETFSYSAADQTTDFGSAQSSIDFGLLQVSTTYGDGIELREAA